MERDFMGIGGSESSAKDSCGGRRDSVVQCLSNNSSSTQQFKPFKTQQEEKLKNAMFDQISSCAFLPIGSFPAESKISFSVDRHNVQQFGCASAQLVPVSQSSIPIGMSSPLFKVHGSCNGPNLAATAMKPQSLGSSNSSLLGPGVGSFAPRNIMKSPPTTAQLTIFYAGSVNVYDDVPWDKAQTVMLKASEGCKATTNIVHTKTEAPVLPLTKGSVSDGLRISQSPMPVNNHAVSSTSHGETSMAMNNSMVAATTATVMPRAVPQARKASLARFLEKRKERVTNTMPYPFEKKDPSWFKGQAKNCEEKVDSPSTKLEM
ncbi:protein TIFY 6b-like [Phalaenopsis equestris]|uniref:protein TIFY 6b-like n=1 Tax=Phalaenopsis equestris TaxID=78828 RepID=UPI0009E5B8F5|nr:protein TIFY 6b-like [Phalaenopsis equestris]